MNSEQAVKAAKKGDLSAQRYLYEQYKVSLFTVCLRYSRDRSEAKDILQEGFLSIFKDLHQYKEKGDIGKWMRKVVVNTALQYLRKWKKDWAHVDCQDYEQTLFQKEQVYNKLGEEELMKMIQQLPQGYRVVFNLYVIEGYNHHEIADLLGINESTSRSQLYKAKAVLRLSLIHI